MAVAYVPFHRRGRLGTNFFPGVNGAELDLLYGFAFLDIACRGSGCCALDGRRHAARN